MRNILTQKQETFVLNIFKGMTQREAWGKAGYSIKYAPALVDTHACALANTDKIKRRLAELRKIAETEAIADPIERRKILTEIERARFSDFVDEVGNLRITDRAQLKTAAVQEIKTERTLAGYRTTLKLRDPVGAIDIHNKMDKIYSDAPREGDTNIQIIIMSNIPRPEYPQIAEVKSNNDSNA